MPAYFDDWAVFAAPTPVIRNKAAAAFCRTGDPLVEGHGVSANRKRLGDNYFVLWLFAVVAPRFRRSSHPKTSRGNHHHLRASIKILEPFGLASARPEPAIGGTMCYSGGKDFDPAIIGRRGRCWLGAQAQPSDKPLHWFGLREKDSNGIWKPTWPTKGFAKSATAGIDPVLPPMSSSRFFNLCT